MLARALGMYGKWTIHPAQIALVNDAFTPRRDEWDRAEAIIRPFAWAIAVALLVGLVWFVWNRIRQIRREEAARASRPPPDVPGRAVASPRAPDAGVSPLEGTIPTGTAERVEET